jgi:hypothetical protein
MPSGVRKEGGEYVIFDKRTGKRVGKSKSKRKAHIAASIRDRDVAKGAMREAHAHGDTKTFFEQAALVRYYGELAESRRGMHFPAWDPRLHPRDRLGQFRDVLKMLDTAPKGSTASLPGGYEITKGFRRYKIRHRGGVVGSGATAENVLRAYEQAMARQRHVEEFDRRKAGITGPKRRLTPYEVERGTQELGAF